MKKINIYIFVLLIYFLFFSEYQIDFFENNIPSVSFPFKNLYDDKGKKLPIITISAFFRSDSHKNLYNKYKEDGLHFLGCSSYLEFPGEIDNPHEDPYYKNHDDNYEEMVDAWLHCFRNPEKYLKTNIPRALISESDFIDYEYKNPIPMKDKKYDFIYICLDEGAKHDSKDCKLGWQSYNRNWKLAKECLKVMCGECKLKGLIIGRTNCDITEKCNNRIDFIPFQPQSKFLELLQDCRFIFVPNVHDASPRVITHAFCYNIPVLMNINIIGGWKYLNNKTGVFFNSEKDIFNSIVKLKRNINNFSSRDWYYKNYGKENSGRRLLQFLKKHYPDVDFTDIKYVRF